MSYEVTTWEDINPLPDLLPEQDFTFQIQGGAADDNDPGTVVMKVAVVNDGDNNGTLQYVRFWNPATAREAWQAKQTLKDFRRLQLTIGVDPLPAAENNRWGFPGEDPVDYLNRAAAQNARFGAPIKHRPAKDDPDTKYANINIRAMKAAV